VHAVDRPEDLGFDPARLGRIRAWMADYVNGGRFPFACTLVARRGEIAFCDFLGRRDLASGAPYGLDTIVRVYSMTKPITAVAALMLYEEGRLHLDDPVAEFLPGFDAPLVLRANATALDQVEPARAAPTLHTLLTHTSGLIYGSQGGVLGKAYRERGVDFGPAGGGLAANVERLAGLPLAFEPGCRWNYGVSTDLLGRVIEVVSGQTLDAFLRERIFEPLAMTDTGFEVAEDRLGRLAKLYGPAREGGGPGGAMAERDGAEDSEFRAGRVDTLSGGGGLLSTAHDYLRFAEMLRKGGRVGGTLDGARLLGPRTVALMTANHLPGDIAQMGPRSWAETSFEGVGFGLGVWVMGDPARAGLSGSPGDFGWGGVASTVFWVDPREDMTVLFLTQLSPSHSTPNRKELRALVYQALVD
jgi:CubicO group peptidase (beta-lactamase class C family)